jgi:hypothetical protein
MEDAALSDPIIEPVKEYNPNSSQLPGGYVFGCIYIYIYIYVCIYVYMYICIYVSIFIFYVT